MGAKIVSVSVCRRTGGFQVSIGSQCDTLWDGGKMRTPADTGGFHVCIGSVVFAYCRDSGNRVSTRCTLEGVLVLISIICRAVVVHIVAVRSYKL